MGATNISVTIGNQESREFWQQYLKDKPKFDIVIEDGGHTMNQQIVTYEELYNHVTDTDVYLCEDLHTSYWSLYGGQLNKPSTFIEYSKKFVDMLNFYHIVDDISAVKDKYENFRKKTDSVHYYDSVIVLEKKLDLERPVATVR